MNAIERPERLHALARHARHRQRALGRARRRDRRVQGRGLRPGDRRDRGHRPGRRRDRAARRRLALRDDAGVRRREPAREDRHARLRRLRRDQQVRPRAAPRTRCATCASSCSATARLSRTAPEDDAGVRHHRLALQRRRRHRALPRGRREARERLKRQAGHAAEAARARFLRGTRRRAAEARSATSPRSPRRVRGYHQHADEQSRLARERQQLEATQAMLGKQRCRSSTRCSQSKNRSTPQAQKLLESWPKTVKAYSGDEHVVKVRGKEIRTRAHHAPRSPARKVPKVALPRTRTTASCCAGACARTCRASSRSPPACSRFKRENEDPTRMFAGEGDPFRTNRRFHLLSQRHAGEAPVDRVRLGDALRLRPGRAARHLRQGRQLAASRSPRSTT